MGTLITHGVRSLHWATPGQTIAFPVELDMAAYNVPAGHHLALVVDTQDARYGKASNNWFGVDFMFSGDLVSSLTIPIFTEPELPLASNMKMAPPLDRLRLSAG